ncbi:MAG: FMN-binding protein [Treponema sp.]|jgi:electron transport complex protein RnfG|nr:FMN-binding protein [Treponema sp.]
MSAVAKGGGFGGMLKLGFTLAVFAAAACVMLAFVYTGTERIIAMRQQADLEATLKELFPEADSFTDISGTIASPDLSVTFESEYEVRRDGVLIGAALRCSRASYNGQIKVLAGINAGGTVSGVKILEHSDTPGLGANAAAANYFVDRAAGLTFYGQFAGKSVSEPFEVKEDVIAVTASTITSRAVAAAVKAAGDAALAYLGGAQ